MKQTKQFLRPLLMAIVMLVGMHVPQGAWAQVTLYTQWGDEFWYESIAKALDDLEYDSSKFGDGPVTMRFDQDIALSEELDLSRLGRDITIDLNDCVLTHTMDPCDMSCIVDLSRDCEYRITIQNGKIESNQLDAIYFRGKSSDNNSQLILENVNVVTHQEGRHCLFDAKRDEWEEWGYDFNPESSPKLQIIDSQFHSNGCSAISFTLLRNDEFVKSILPEGYSFYNANTGEVLEVYADRPFVDENGNPATDIRTGFITSWTWADDHSSATLRINHEDVDAVVTNEVTTPATCVASGVRTYTAAATYRDRNYADTKDEEIAIDPDAHSFASKTLTAEPDEDSHLYAYVCDREGCGEHGDYNVVKSDEGESATTIELTANTDGETTTYTASATVAVPDGAFSTPIDFTATGDQVTIDRTFTTGTPATINLPFDVPASAMSETYYTFGGIEQNSEGKWVATMVPVPTTGTLTANTPYIVLPSGTNISITDNAATVSFKADASANSTTTNGDWTMKAAKTPKTWGTGDLELGKAYGFAAKAEGNINAGQFVKVGVGASIAAGRAYLQYNGEGTPTRAGELELPSTIEVRFVVGSTTGIGTIDTESGEFTFDGWYDLNGRRVSEPTKGGIYFNKNKKIIVK